MDITREDYQVQYDEAAATVRCSGSFRLHGDEYKPMLDLLGHAADTKSAMLTLDVRELQFLNSSGINTLCASTASASWWCKAARAIPGRKSP